MEQEYIQFFKNNDLIYSWNPGCPLNIPGEYDYSMFSDKAKEIIKNRLSDLYRDKYGKDFKNFDIEIKDKYYTDGISALFDTSSFVTYACILVDCTATKL